MAGRPPTSLPALARLFNLEAPSVGDELSLLLEQLEQLGGWLTTSAVDVCEFAVEPFDARADVHIWLVTTHKDLYAPTVARYERALTLDMPKAHETHLARGVVVRYAPIVVDQVAISQGGADAASSGQASGGVLDGMD